MLREALKKMDRDKTSLEFRESKVVEFCLREVKLKMRGRKAIYNLRRINLTTVIDVR